jgi:hypothetical protein
VKYPENITARAEIIIIGVFIFFLNDTNERINNVKKKINPNKQVGYPKK